MQGVVLSHLAQLPVGDKVGDGASDHQRVGHGGAAYRRGCPSGTKTGPQTSLERIRFVPLFLVALNDFKPVTLAAIAAFNIAIVTRSSSMLGEDHFNASVRGKLQRSDHDL